MYSLVEISRNLTSIVCSCFYECFWLLHWVPIRVDFYGLLHQNCRFWCYVVQLIWHFINLKGAIMLHDCIYQFLRLFYHSRFKPIQLKMTWAQFATPVIDVVLVLPLILRLVQNISGLTNETKMRWQSKSGINGHVINQVRLDCRDFLSIQIEKSWLKFLIFSPFFLSAVACLPESNEKTKLAILYKAKIYRKKIISGMKVRDSSE